MNEREIIKGKKINIKKLCLIIGGIGAFFGTIVTFYAITSSNFYSGQDFSYLITSAIPYFMSFTFLPFLVLAIIIYFCLSKVDIVVTDKRVYGKAIFGKRVDLPFDTISAVGTSFLKGIDVGTSAGRIHFKAIDNNIEVHTEISKLLNLRQSQKDSNQSPSQSNNISTTEELKKYKELLDCGVITQDDFDAKKKQLLGL